MTSRLGSFTPGGPAESRRSLRAGLLDLLAATVVALLSWPFPLLRLTLQVPWPVHVPLILLWIAIVDIVYVAVCVRVWRRTPAMYLLDLGLAGRPRPFRFGLCLAWAGGSLLALAPAVLGLRRPLDPSTGLGARLSGLRTVAAAPAEG